MKTQIPILPTILRKVKRLVRQHLQITDEPLLLAIYYRPKRNPRDIFLFEVIENFGNGAAGEDKEFFEVTFGSGSSLMLEPGQKLHLVMTNPQELETAAHENWPMLKELQAAIRADRSRVLFGDPKYAHLRETVHA